MRISKELNKPGKYKLWCCKTSTFQKPIRYYL